MKACRVSVAVRLILGLVAVIGPYASAQPFTTLYSFTGGSDGADPYGGLVPSGDSLYGTTYSGGLANSFQPAGGGTVFKVNMDGTGFSTLYSFTGGSDGACPGGRLTVSASTLYGAALNGGGYTRSYWGLLYYGTVFSVNTDGSDFTALYSGAAGIGPNGGLVLSGNALYGTTEGGGSYGRGTVFKLNTDGTAFTVLYSFSGGSDGADPNGGLALSGNTLYGTTGAGEGTGGSGTIFQVNTDGTGYGTLYSFTALTDNTNSDGAGPSTVVLSGHTLYGTANGGGTAGMGTVWKMDVDGTGFATLHSFSALAYPGAPYPYYTNSDGAHPAAGLALWGNTLYGTAADGGTYGCGTVFRVNTDGTGFTTLYSFTGGSDRGNPAGALVLGGHTLYGTTASSLGTVFALALLQTNPVITWSAPAAITYGTGLGPSQLDASASVAGTLAYNPLAGTVLDAGTGVLAVVFSPSDTVGYTSATGSVSIVVLPAPLAATANNATRLYGAANPAFSGGLAGLLNGDSIGVTFSSPATTGSSVGTYPIVPSLVDTNNRLRNYVVSLTNGTLAITPAPLAVSANSAARLYGAANPLFTGSIVGLQNGDNITAVYSTPAGQGSGPGAYPIVPTVVDPGNRLGNYTLSVSNGTLTITEAPLTVSANSATRPYGAANPLFTGSVVGLANGDNIRAAYSTPATPASGVGTYPIVPSLVDPNNRVGNYAVSISDGTLTVTPALLTVTASNLTRAYEASNPVFTGSVVGLQNGDNIGAVYSCSATSTSPPGAYAIVPSLVDPADLRTNYQTSLVDGTLTVSGQPCITNQPASLTVAVGTKAEFSVGAASFTAAGYQWLCNGTNLPGATAASLTLIAARMADAGSYEVVVRNSYGAATSQVAALTVSPNAVPNLLVVVTNGNGSVSPDYNGKRLKIGQAYTMTATAGSGFLFSGWTGDATTNTVTLHFTMRSNMVLVANFVSNPFIAVRGTYNGLFGDETNAPSPENCGCFAVMVTAKGGYSGNLQAAGGRYSLSGQFDLTGRASQPVAVSKASTLTVSLQLDLANGTDRVQGTVSGDNWTAALAGDRAVYDGVKNMAPEAGSYTMVLPGVQGSTTEPGGDSCATVTVSEAGAISARCWLADGTTLTPTATVSKCGGWPFYASLYGGQGVLWGWLGFTNAADLGGSVVWIKQPVRGQPYPAGFSLAAAAVGLRYFPPGRGTNVFGVTVTTNLTLTLTGGGLARGITNRVALAANDSVKSLSGTGLSMSFTPTTGAFNGSVGKPITSSPLSFRGVVLQEQGAGSGFFTGGSESGEVRIGP